MGSEAVGSPPCIPNLHVLSLPLRPTCLAAATTREGKGRRRQWLGLCSRREPLLGALQLPPALVQGTGTATGFHLPPPTPQLGVSWNHVGVSRYGPRCRDVGRRSPWAIPGDTGSWDSPGGTGTPPRSRSPAPQTLSSPPTGAGTASLTVHWVRQPLSRACENRLAFSKRDAMSKATEKTLVPIMSLFLHSTPGSWGGGGGGMHRAASMGVWLLGETPHLRTGLGSPISSPGPGW